MEPKCSRKTLWLNLPARWSWSTSDLKAIHRGLLWATLVRFYFTPGFCSQWPQTDLAADLPDTDWLKHDPGSGSPVISLCKPEPDLLSSSAHPQKYKELFLSLSPSHNDKQESWTADDLGELRETTPPASRKDYRVRLIWMNVITCKLVFLATSNTYICVCTYQKPQPQRQAKWASPAHS